MLSSPWGFHGPSQTVAVVSIAKDANEQFRPYMEDGHTIADPLLVGGGRDRESYWGLFAVYDGHGGRQEVDYCETKLHDVVLAELRGLGPGVDVGSALTSAFAKVDNQLAMLGAWTSGCTATVALVHRQRSGLTLHVANVGDSRAVIIGGSSTRRVSTDHRASDPAEAQRVAGEGGIIWQGRVGGQLSVSRSLGDHNLKSCGVSSVPAICTCSTGENHALVIASDGLWDAVDDGEAQRVLTSCVEHAVDTLADREAIAKYLRDNAARNLVDRAKERGSRDNILAVVAFF